jgi:nucleotide-binding universal stress UspA family protein
MLRALQERRKRKEGNKKLAEGKAQQGKGTPAAPNSGQESLSPDLGSWDASQEASRPKPSENRKILVVGLKEAFSEAVMDYAINLAERLGYAVLAVNVDPELGPSGTFLSPYKRYLQEEFKKQARAAAAGFAERVAAKGLKFDHLVRFGDVTRAIEDLNREIKRIDFVITTGELNEDEVTAEVTLPVFTIKGDRGERIMAERYGGKNMKLIGKTIACGVASLALYAAVFLNSGTVMKYFTRGGWYAALPVLTVFVFSFVHGAFASNLWSALGIEATRKAVQPRPEVKRPVRRKRPRPELRLNA